MGIFKSITSFFKGKKRKKEISKDEKQKSLVEDESDLIIKPKLKPKLESKPKRKTEPKSKPKPKLKPESKSEVKPKPKPKPEPQPEPKSEPKSELKSKPKPKLEPKSEPKPKPKPNIDKEIKIENSLVSEKKLRRKSEEEELSNRKIKLEKGLEKTKKSFFSRLGKVLLGKSKVDDQVLDDLEEVLISSDIGVSTTVKIIQALELRVSKDKYIGTDQLMKMLREEIIDLLLKQQSLNSFDSFNHSDEPYVIMVVGVNGVGKTTTIGKLARKYKETGKEVILGASDTFRAAAIDQLKIWAEKVNVPIVSQQMGSDPASVAYDTLQSAKSSNKDVVIIDTAGRLHNKINLMNELSKIKQVMSKIIPNAPHEVLLVLDGTTGQNAFEQTKQFTAATDVNALAITKLDGTSKGGVVLGVSDQFQIPVKYIGIGEKIDDLQLFESKEFVATLFS